MRDAAFFNRFNVQASSIDDGPVAVLEPGLDCEELIPFDSPLSGDVRSPNPFGVEPPVVQVEEITSVESGCQQKIFPFEAMPDTPLASSTAPPKEPPTFKPPREVVRLVVGLIAATMARISAVWHHLHPDEAFYERIDESAKEALRPPYTKPKIEAFKQLLGEWEASELDRVKRWIEAARERTDGWDAVRCGLCEFRIGELTAGGARMEKAIQIAFSELSGD